MTLCEYSVLSETYIAVFIEFDKSLRLTGEKNKDDSMSVSG